MNTRVGVTLAMLFFTTITPAQSNPPGDWQNSFRTPPDSAKPWAYWWWVNGNVTKASITRDLEQMKQKGFAGLLMFDARGYHEDHLPPPPSRLDFMGPEWRRMLAFAMAEASRLGLKMSVNLSSCAGALRGPRDVGDNAPGQLVWGSADVAGGRRFAGPLPSVQGQRVREVAVVAARLDDAADPSRALEVVDLSDKVDPQGHLTWKVPPGRWKLLRFACAVIKGHEADVDILDAAAVQAYFDRMGRALLQDAGPLAGKTLTHLYSVSWEGAVPTWTVKLESEFARYRGYRPRLYLPALAGLTVQSREVSERFLRDYHKTLGDCFRLNCYGTLRAACRRAGLQWHSESGGPWDRKLPGFQHADQLAFLGQNDMPQGEFWYPERGINRPAAMAAHIYGRSLAAAEAFTHMRPHWSVYPAILKPCADTAFCDGINHLIWHTFTASPPEFGQPGIEYFAGSHLNPNVTWFEQSGAFLTYLARCQFLLRQGQPVSDVCCYTGDKPYRHWGRAEKWSDRPTLTLAKGFTYDLVNTEVLLERLAVDRGDLVLPEGVRYRLLVVDLEDDTVLPQVLRKLRELARAGATIVLGQRRPRRAPGLTDFPTCDDEVRRLAAELWGPAGKEPKSTTVGKGRVITGRTMDDVLQTLALPPDYTGPAGYAHRRTADTDIYFVTGTGSVECAFRVSGKEPELWDPVTGRVQDAVRYRLAEDGRIVVPLTLPESGAMFVVFRRPAAPVHLASIDAPPDAVEIRGRTERGIRLHLWQGGKVTLRTAPAAADITLAAVQVPTPQPLDGPWEVRFAPGWGAPAAAVFKRLIPWNEHAEEGIKYFSGTACYRKSFKLTRSQAGGLCRLQLGEVKHIATVRLNGKPLGIVWTAPWTVDLTGVAKPGKNDLEIDVTNLWVNRLIGDARLPEEKRFTRTNARRLPENQGRFGYLRGYLPDDPLVRSGLLGSVRVEFGTVAEVKLAGGR